MVFSGVGLQGIRLLGFDAFRVVWILIPTFRL